MFRKAMRCPLPVYEEKSTSTCSTPVVVLLTRATGVKVLSSSQTPTSSWLLRYPWHRYISSFREFR